MVPEHERWLYDQVQPVCLYYLKLRYSFLQLLYDQMFNNLWTGLPIARALVISFPEDASLVGENSEFLDNEYTVGDDLLVAPVLKPKATRTVYLPRPAAWWQCNLRATGPDDAAALQLKHEFNGGSLVVYDAHLHREGQDLGFITPMFIRFGGIIPQTEPGLYAEDWKPISIHIYPGHVGSNRSYAMYIDDGLSASSAPTIDTIRSNFFPKNTKLPNLSSNLWNEVRDDGAFSSSKAKDQFWKFEIRQSINHSKSESTSEWRIERRITVEPKHKNDDGLLTSTSGKWCRLIIWGEPKRKEAFQNATCSPEVTIDDVLSWPTEEGVRFRRYESTQNAWHVWLDLRETTDITFSYASGV
ncbi:hypothetical protein FRC12_004340 [Ceratobasidium sp. 428]|nr:hypothetical protein FRC12_004340 [Ceratobasidium sp. 428]